MNKQPVYVTGYQTKMVNGFSISINEFDNQRCYVNVTRISDQAWVASYCIHIPLEHAMNIEVNDCKSGYYSDEQINERELGY